MSQCDNYKSISDRQVRCVHLKMCSLNFVPVLKHNPSSFVWVKMINFHLIISDVRSVLT